MMYIPLFDIFGGQERFRLRYKFDNANRYICRREDYPFETLDCGYCLQAMKNSRCVIIEIDGLGSFVFTDHRHSDLFWCFKGILRRQTVLSSAATMRAGISKSSEMVKSDAKSPVSSAWKASATAPRPGVNPASMRSPAARV